MSSDKKQIYIVDDDESVCRALKLLMSTYGFAVKKFLFGEEFFSAVPKSPPGCLILDIHMPGLDGWDALRKLKETGFKHWVIIISGDKNGDLKEKALKEGAVGFLHKPFTDKALIDLIKVAFEKK